MNALGRLIAMVSAAIAASALIASVISHIAPMQPLIVRSRPDEVSFIASRYGRLVLWKQVISPPPPTAVTVTLTRPYRFDVRAAGSRFQRNFNPDWPRPDEGWEPTADVTGSIHVSNQPYKFTLQVRYLLIQWRIVFVLAMIAPAVRLTFWWMRRRNQISGRCAVCGYDLRATPEAGGALLDRCPECGAIPRF